MVGVTIPAAHGAFVSCGCVARWWPLVEAMCAARGWPVPEVTQGSYQPVTPFSAATHTGGGVIDVMTGGDYADLDGLVEDMGGVCYVRTPADGFVLHAHVIVTGCPHLHTTAQAQIAAWMDGLNGLANKRPDRDPTRPAVLRTWREGVEWARRQLQRIEDDMNINELVTVPLISNPLNPDGPKMTVAQCLYHAVDAKYKAAAGIAGLGRVLAAFVAAEKGADAAITKRVNDAVDLIVADLGDLDANLGALSAHLGGGNPS